MRLSIQSCPVWTITKEVPAVPLRLEALGVPQQVAAPGGGAVLGVSQVARDHSQCTVNYKVT